MGLKNTNCIIKGNKYNEIYAVFNGDIQRLGNDFVVSFNIQTSRELALNGSPLEVRKVRIKDWDRKTDIVALAYKIAKEELYIAREYPETFDFIEPLDLGWQDDIVGGYDE